MAHSNGDYGCGYRIAGAVERASSGEIVFETCRKLEHPLPLLGERVARTERSDVRAG